MLQCLQEVSSMLLNAVEYLVIVLFHVYFAEGLPTEITERIVGGQPARDGQFPWMVALYYRNGFTCTASLISTTTVLTAAHCVERNGVALAASEFYGIAGNVNRSSPTTRLEFSSVTIHPEYANLQKDIAYFRLTEPVAVSDNIVPICVARSDTGLDEYKNATSMGWGSVSNIPIYLDNLMYVDVKILPHATCKARYMANADDNHVCADGFGRGICYGDSGGPLVHSSNDKPPVNIGVASFVRRIPGCGSLITSPGVYTRMSSYTEWVLSSSGDGEICTV